MLHDINLREIFECAHLKFTVSGRSKQASKQASKQTNIHITHARAQCSHASVGLAPIKTFWCHFMLASSPVSFLASFCCTLYVTGARKEPGIPKKQGYIMLYLTVLPRKLCPSFLFSSHLIVTISFARRQWSHCSTCTVSPKIKCTRIGAMRSSNRFSNTLGSRMVVTHPSTMSWTLQTQNLETKWRASFSERRSSIYFCCFLMMIVC